MSNESVEKPPHRDWGMVSGGHLTLRKHEIVDCRAFCEAIFFHISPQNPLENFFYSLNETAHWPRGKERPLCSRLFDGFLVVSVLDFSSPYSGECITLQKRMLLRAFTAILIRLGPWYSNTGSVTSVAHKTRNGCFQIDIRNVLCLKQVQKLIV